MSDESDNRVPCSIVIPTWNRPDLLPQAVGSALSALPPGCEVVVTDDRSDPPAKACLGELSSPALRIVVNTGKRGAAANRNFGVSQARGEVILFLDDDDEMRQGYPMAVLEAFGKARHAWGFSTMRDWSPADRKPYTGPIPESGLENLPARKRLAGLGCGFWISRELFIETGGIDETLSVNEDTELSIRLHAGGWVPARSAEPGILVRRDDSGLTGSSAPGERARCFRAIIERHADYLDHNPDMRRFLTWRLLKMLAKDGQVAQGFRDALARGSTTRKLANLIYYLCTLAITRRVN